MQDSLVVVFIAETDPDNVYQVAFRSPTLNPNSTDLPELRDLPGGGAILPLPPYYFKK